MQVFSNHLVCLNSAPASPYQSTTDAPIQVPALHLIFFINHYTQRYLTIWKKKIYHYFRFIMTLTRILYSSWFGSQLIKHSTQTKNIPKYMIVRNKFWSEWPGKTIEEKRIREGKQAQTWNERCREDCLSFYFLSSPFACFMRMSWG